MTRIKKPTVVRFLVKFSLALLIALTLAFFWLSAPASRSDNLQTFEIKPGESATTIAKNLQRVGLIRSPLYFRLLVRLQDLTLQAGIYQVAPNLPPRQLVLTLTRGFGTDLKFTIPEGYRLEQTATVISDKLGIDPTSFLAASKGKEGRLFPDTYFVKAGTTAAEVVALMESTFISRYPALSQEDLILASLVERETRAQEEKPIVAGILKKRLEAGWPLELDATVQYALGTSTEWWPTTTLLDRQVNSPYNTYTNPGLPPAPISAPGSAAIEAVQNPQDSPYWFYLHDREGNIRYAATAAEHSANISKYIR